MSADLIPFPGPPRFVAVSGGPALFIIGVWIGEASSQNPKDQVRTCTSFLGAQRIARDLAGPEDLEVRLLCHRPNGGGDEAA